MMRRCYAVTYATPQDAFISCRYAATNIDAILRAAAAAAATIRYGCRYYRRRYMLLMARAYTLHCRLFTLLTPPALMFRCRALARDRCWRRARDA